METTVNRIDAENIELTITLPVERVDKAISKTYQRISSSQKIPGFRAGKVPKHVIDNMYGADAVAGMTLEDLLQEAYWEACEKESIYPVGSPEFDPFPTLTASEPLEIKAKVLVLPEFEVCDISMIPADFTRNPVVDEADVDRTVNGIKLRMADYVPLVEDRGAIETDKVIVDYKFTAVRPDGTEDNQAERQDVPVIIGGDSGYKDFEDNFLGLKTGDVKTFEIPIDKNEDRGVAKYEVMVKSVEKMQPFESDEAFLAKLEDQYKDMDELKENVRRSIEHRMRESHESKITELVINYIMDGTDLKVPDPLVDEEIEFRLANLENMLESGGKTIHEYCDEAGTSVEKLKADEFEDALKTVKSRIIFNRIFADRDMVISPVEVETYVRRYAMENGIARNELKKLAKNRDFVAMIRQRIRNAKVTLFLKTRVKFTDDKESPAPLNADGGKKEDTQADTVNE